jgi:UDP-glucose 4-epimerase
MSLKNRSVLVTGGAGFIGSHLVDRIISEEPENLVIVDNFFLGKESNLKEAQKIYPGLKIYREDASSQEKMEEIVKNECIDVLFNLAVIPLPASFSKPRWTFEHNVDISLTMCELARNDFFDTLIHFSSSEAYGTCEYAPMDENHPLKGKSPYAASKAASDQLIFSYYRTFGIKASIVRPFNNYGPRQNEGTYAGVIPLTIKRILNNEAPVIYGDGKQTRDYLYVTDTADAAVSVYINTNTRGKVLNIASGKEISIETLIKAIATYLHCDIPIVYGPERQGDVRRHIANIFLAEDLIEFRPTVGLEEGLTRTISWYKENLWSTSKTGNR